MIPKRPMHIPAIRMVSTIKFTELKRWVTGALKASRCQDFRKVITLSKPFFIMTKSMNTLLLKGISEPRAEETVINARLIRPSFQSGATNLAKNRISR